MYNYYYFTALSHYYWEKDAAFKAILKEKAMEKFENSMKCFEERVKKNGGFFVGGKVNIKFLKGV